MKSILLFFLLFATIVVCLPHHKKDTDTDKPKNDAHKHGHSRVKIVDCDDTKNGIGIDWDGEDDEINEDFYKCTKGKLGSNINENAFATEHVEPPPIGYHVCLKDKIVYNSSIPMGGPHRPVWSTYGEYLYMPPQRWIHSAEHGAAIFLYDPCAENTEIEAFKKLAKGCLRRHIITPHNSLPNGLRFVIVTFGRRLEMNKVTGNVDAMKKYLKEHAVKDGPEFPLGDDGDYNFGLLHKSPITDIKDSNICAE